MTRKTLSAKCGVWLIRNRNCFSATGTSFTSLTATAVALRGVKSIKAISPEDGVVGQRLEHAIAEADLDLAVLNDEQLLGIVTLTEDDVARLEFAHRHPGPSQYPKIDRRDRHKQGPSSSQLSPLIGSAE
jgi:hypothetical protein